MRKISTTIILVIGLFVILSLGTVGILGLSAATKALEVETSNRLKAMAQQKSSELEIQLLDIESNINTLHSLVLSKLDDNEATDRFVENIHPLVRQSFESLDSSYSVYVVLNPQAFGDLYEIVYVHSEENNITEQLDNILSTDDLESFAPEMAWYHEPINSGKGVWSNPYFDNFLEKEIITYSEPIYVDGQIVGVIGTDLLFQDFKSFIHSIKVFETGYAFLMNEAHDNIVHPSLEPHTNMRTIEDGLYIPLSNQINVSDYGSIRYKFYGTEKIMGFAHLHNGWIIGIAPPLEEINASLNSMQTTLYISGLIAIVIFLILATIVGKYLSRPIEQLSKSVIRIGEGELHEPIDAALTQRASEFGHLALAIEKMRVKQKDAINDLLSHNQTLDRKVEERTNELLKINHELEASLHSLKDAQQTIVDMHEQETVHDLVQHITQKLSVPMANTLTAASYLINQTGYNEKIHQSAHIIHDSQLEIKQLLVSLKQLMDDYSDETPRHIPIKAFVNHTIQNILSERKCYLSVKVIGDDELMVTLPMDLTNRLVTNITEHALRLHKHYKDQSEIQLELTFTDDWLTLAYYDVIPWQENVEVKLFNPYYQSELTGSNSGLELFLIQHIVTKGFQGTIDLVESDKHKVTFLLNLPQHKTK